MTWRTWHVVALMIVSCVVGGWTQRCVSRSLSEYLDARALVDADYLLVADIVTESRVLKNLQDDLEKAARADDLLHIWSDGLLRQRTAWLKKLHERRLSIIKESSDEEVRGEDDRPVRDTT